MNDEIFECAHPSASKIFTKKSNLRVNQFLHTRHNNNALTTTTSKLKAFDRPGKPLVHNNIGITERVWEETKSSIKSLYFFFNNNY